MLNCIGKHTKIISLNSLPAHNAGERKIEAASFEKRFLYLHKWPFPLEYACLAVVAFVQLLEIENLFIAIYLFIYWSGEMKSNCFPCDSWITIDFPDGFPTNEVIIKFVQLTAVYSISRKYICRGTRSLPPFHSSISMNAIDFILMRNTFYWYFHSNQNNDTFHRDRSIFQWNEETKLHHLTASWCIFIIESGNFLQYYHEHWTEWLQRIRSYFRFKNHYTIVGRLWKSFINCNHIFLLESWWVSISVTISIGPRCGK